MRLEEKKNRDDARALLWDKLGFLEGRFDDHTRSLEEREDDQSKLNICIAQTKLVDSAQKDQLIKRKRLEMLADIKKNLLVRK